MKYSVTAITAKPGEDLKVILTNNGTQPVEVMGHNWVLLKAGTDVAAFDAAALSSKDTGYIPAALAGEIIAKIDLLGPRKSGEATSRPRRLRATIPSSAPSPPTTRPA
jgi:azurin